MIYLEKQVDDNRRSNDLRFGKLEEKIDELKESFSRLEGDVKGVIVKLTIIGGGAVFAIQLVGKHFGWW